MNRFSLFLLTALVLPVFSFAQLTFQPGVVVNLKGDTTIGFINYTEWENNPGSIVFKAAGTSTTQNLTPLDIKFFSASVGHLAEYVGYVGLITTDNTDEYRIAIGKDSSVKQDTVFLRVVQHGKKMLLFSMTDAQKVRFFIAPGFSEKPVELIYRLYWNNAEATADRTVYDNSYKGQLYEAAQKAGVLTDDLKKEIKDAQYKALDLEAITAKINGISAYDTSKNNRVKAKVNALFIFGIAALVLVAMYHFIHVNK